MQVRHSSPRMVRNAAKLFPHRRRRRGCPGRDGSAPPGSTPLGPARSLSGAGQPRGGSAISPPPRGRPRLSPLPMRDALPGCPARALAAAIAEYERIEEILGRLASYAQLLFAADSTDAAIGQFYQTVTERVTTISSDLLFFTLELNRLDEAALEAKLADPALAPWRPWLRDLRVFRPHQLSDELEKLLHEKDVTGHAAWSRLFDETMAGMRIDAGRRVPDRQRRAEQTVGSRSRGARSRRPCDRRGLRGPGEAVRADHQHAGQGQGDRRRLAPLPRPRQRAQPRQHGRGRGRRRRW